MRKLKHRVAFCDWENNDAGFKKNIDKIVVASIPEIHEDRMHGGFPVRPSDLDMGITQFFTSEVPTYWIDAQGCMNLGIYNINSAPFILKKKNFIKLVNQGNGLIVPPESDVPDRMIYSTNLSQVAIRNQMVPAEFDRMSLSLPLDDLITGKSHVVSKYGFEVASIFSFIHGQLIFGEEGVAPYLKDFGAEEKSSIFFPTEERIRKILDGRRFGTKVAFAAYLDSVSLNSDVLLEATYDIGIGAYIYGYKIKKKKADPGLGNYSLS